MKRRADGTIVRRNSKRYMPRRSSPSTTYSARKLYPIYRSVATNIYPFKRQIQQTLAVQQSTGWAGGGYDCAISFSLVQATFFINGSASFGPLLPNSSEFTVLFDQYRIRKVDIRLIFSNNDSNVSTPNATLPVVHCYNDYNDTLGKTLSNVQEYPAMQTYQLGKERDIRWSLTPHVRSDVLTNTGLTSASAMNITSPWIDTSSNNIEHLGTRIYLNTLGRTSAADLGSVLFLIDYHLEFKFVR